MRSIAFPTKPTPTMHVTNSLTGTDKNWNEQREETEAEAADVIRDSVQKIQIKRSVAKREEPKPAEPNPHIMSQLGRIRSTLKTASEALASIKERANPDGTTTPSGKSYSLAERTKPAEILEPEQVKTANGVTSSVETGQRNSAGYTAKPTPIKTTNTVTGSANNAAPSVPTQNKSLQVPPSLQRPAPVAQNNTTYPAGMKPLNFDPQNPKNYAPGDHVLGAQNPSYKRYFDYYTAARPEHANAQGEYGEWNRFADIANSLGRLPTVDELSSSIQTNTSDWGGVTYNDGMSYLGNHVDFGVVSPADRDRLTHQYELARTTKDPRVHGTWNHYAGLANTLGRPPTQAEIVATTPGQKYTAETIQAALDKYNSNSYDHYTQDKSWLGFSQSDVDQAQNAVDGTILGEMSGVAPFLRAGRHANDALYYLGQGDWGEAASSGARWLGNSASAGLSATGVGALAKGAYTGIPALGRALTPATGTRLADAWTATKGLGGGAMNLGYKDFQGGLAEEAGDMAWQATTGTPGVVRPTAGDAGLLGLRAALMSSLPARVTAYGLGRAVPSIAAATNPATAAGASGVGKFVANTAPAVAGGAGWAVADSADKAMTPNVAGVRNRSDLRYVLGAYADPSKGVYDPNTGDVYDIGPDGLAHLEQAISEAKRTSIDIPPGLEEAAKQLRRHYSR